ncbi:MAG: DUF2510 domain-containing protein [Candidatus Dormiibacterota bacterium]
MAVKPGWYDDPWGAHQHRYWDGSSWTANVADDRRVREAPVWEGGGTLFTESVLVVHRWSSGGTDSLLSAAARIYGWRGRLLATASEAVLSVAEQMLAASGGAALEERWRVLDPDGAPLLSVARGALEERPVELRVADAQEKEVGRLLQDLATDATFSAYAEGRPLAVVRLQPAPGVWWTVRDANGKLLAQASPQPWASMPSGARHVVEIPQRLEGPAGILVAACALALHEDLVHALV